MALDLVEIDVLDIAFGTSGYKLQMAARSKRVGTMWFYSDFGIYSFAFSVTF